MKIAVAGKGGVGKSTICALLGRFLRETGNKVLLIDADPDSNLASILGIPEETAITPITELKSLIAERTGTTTNEASPLFRMNPRVDDIPDKYCVEINGIKLLVMGTIKRGGGGCACPENAFVKSLISHIVIQRNEWVVMDMEAGIEHLGRGTAIGVDVVYVVVEPSRTSMNTASRIKGLAYDLGIKKIKMIGNKIKSKEDSDFIVRNSNDFEVAGFIPFMEEIISMNTGDKDVFSLSKASIGHMEGILSSL
jgi:CO dehydrogenase maturation factor